MPPPPPPSPRLGLKEGLTHFHQVLHNANLFYKFDKNQENESKVSSHPFMMSTKNGQFFDPPPNARSM